MKSEHVVRPATVSDVQSMARVMARAFADDPLMAWVLPRTSTRVARMESWFGSVYRLVSLRALEMYTTEPVKGVAEWAAPGKWRLPRRNALLTLPSTIRCLGSGAWRISSAMATLESEHPHDPHWYLGGLGTDPDHRGHGVATALLRPVLDRCDLEGTPAYLETQKEQNLAFYERHGFLVVGELDIAGGGPHMWRMWRKPAT